MQVKKDARKEEEVKKESQDDDSVLTDVETYSDGEFGEVSQGILYRIEKVFSRFSGAAANNHESTPGMVLEKMVYEVSHEREPTLFQCHIRTGVKGMDWSDSI